MNTSDARTPLSITTEDLTLAVDGIELAVRSTGERVFVEAESVRDALHVVRALPTDSSPTGLAAFLTATDLTTEFRVRGRTVVVLGAAARPGFLSEQLGVAPAEVRLAGAVGAAGGGLSAISRRIRRLLG